MCRGALRKGKGNGKEVGVMRACAMDGLIRWFVLAGLEICLLVVSTQIQRSLWN